METKGSRGPRDSEARRRAGLGAIAGVLAAGTALGVGQLVAGLTGANGSPVVAVGQLQIDFTPPWLKNFAISEFGSDDKLVLVSGILVVLGIFAAVIGAAATRRLAYGMAGLVVFAVIGLTAAATRPTATAASLLPTLAATAAAAIVLRLLIERAWAAAPAGPRTWAEPRADGWDAAADGRDAAADGRDAAADGWDATDGWDAAAGTGPALDAQPGVPDLPGSLDLPGPPDLPGSPDLPGPPDLPGGMGRPGGTGGVIRPSAAQGQDWLARTPGRPAAVEPGPAELPGRRGGHGGHRGYGGAGGAPAGRTEQRGKRPERAEDTQAVGDRAVPAARRQPGHPGAGVVRHVQ